MSVLRLAEPQRANVIQRPKLKVVSGVSNARTFRPNFAVVATVIAGLGLVALTQLLLSIAISQGSYDLAELKREKRELGTTSQILSEQVASLSSQQNLSNAAQSLGMVSNSNPVYLRLSDQKIIGKPKQAVYSSQIRVAGNLVPNAALTLTSQAEIAAAESKSKSDSTDSAKGDVNQSNQASGQVNLPSGGIPASPTR